LNFNKELIQMKVMTVNELCQKYSEVFGEDTNALNKSAIKRLWWFVGVISAGIFGVAFYMIRSGVN